MPALIRRLADRFAGRVAWNLCANGVQGVLAILTLPIATLVLGPPEFGIYALVLSVTSLLIVCSESGAGIVLAARYEPADVAERRRLAASVLALSIIIAAALAMAFVALCPLIGSLGVMTLGISAADVILAALAMPAAAAAMAIRQVLVIAGRSHEASVATIVQSFATFAAILLGLFAFDIGLTSLFAGNLAGQLASLLTLAFIWRPDFAAPSRRWIAEVLRAIPIAITGGLLESARNAIENAALARFAGVNLLGLYSHSKLYGSFLLQGTNAVALAIWPRALAEARRPNAQFEAVGKAWNTVHLGVLAFGLIFALIGPEIVGALTNGKFSDAGTLVPIWIAILLVQISGRPAMATLYAFGRGAAAARARAMSVLISTVCLVVAIPRFGLAGALTVLFAEMLVYRIWIQVAAQRLRPLPFQDMWVIAGCLAIGFAMIVRLALADSFSGRLLVLAGSLALIVVLGRSVLHAAVNEIRALAAAS